MAVSRYLFSISILSLLVWTAACFMPQLRASYDDGLEMDSLDYRKRSADADRLSSKQPAKGTDQRPLKTLADLSEEDINRALSRLSGAEIESLDRLMDEEAHHEMDKRDANVYVEEEQAHEWKVNAANGDGYEDYDELEDETGLSKHCERRQERHRHSEHGQANQHGLNKRMADTVDRGSIDLFRRDSSFNLAADKHVQAKIDLLREKQKRQMAGESW